MANVFVDKKSRNEMILRLWGSGMSAKDIAERMLGPDASSTELRRGRTLVGVVVHQARKDGDPRAAYRYRMPKELNGVVRYEITVSDYTSHKLEAAATKYGLSETEMIRHLIELIAKDDLFNAVIDDG